MLCIEQKKFNDFATFSLQVFEQVNLAKEEEITQQQDAMIYVSLHQEIEKLRARQPKRFYHELHALITKKASATPPYQGEGAFVLETLFSQSNNSTKFKAFIQVCEGIASNKQGFPTPASIAHKFDNNFPELDALGLSSEEKRLSKQNW